jgi:hypothetical protein
MNKIVIVPVATRFPLYAVAIEGKCAVVYLPYSDGKNLSNYLKRVRIDHNFSFSDESADGLSCVAADKQLVDAITARLVLRANREIHKIIIPEGTCGFCCSRLDSANNCPNCGQSL